MIKKIKIGLLLTLAIGICAIASAEVVDRIVAVVNNEIITLSDLNKAILPYKSNIEASQNSSEKKQELIQTLERDVLQQLIDRSLTSQEAAKYHIEVSKEDIDSAIHNFMTANKMDPEELEAALAADGLTLKDYQSKMKKEILQSRLISRAVRSQVIITDADVKAYYDSHVDAFTGVKKYHLRNILMDAEADLAEIEPKIGNLVSFEQLAKEHSIASNAADGGDLGVFDINNFSEKIKLSLQALGKGDHTPVLYVGQGYQILFVEDILMEGNKTLDQARDQIENILYKEQAEKRFKEWIESLKTHAHIKNML
ncbi:MAG: SurA N-terminal domain-containing protein [Desulfobacterales bacterium]|nr:SurA N-terminal domain-containing protein [Desulfobacterales bacterium]